MDLTELTIYNEVRKRINEFKDYTIKNILRIAYVYGVEPSEYLGPRKTNDQSIKGNDFFIDTINDSDALVLNIPTIRKGRRIRSIAVPLNPKIEPMSKHILEFTEELGENRIWHTFYENFWKNVRSDYKIFKLIQFPKKAPRASRERKGKINLFRPLSLTHLTEVRQMELSLCNNFNELDFKLFCGNVLPSDYHIYYNKLLNKSDYYEPQDVYDALVLRNNVFNPKGDYKYHYKDYIKIIQLIKRGYIKEIIEELDIDYNIDISKISSSKSGEKEHKILMANIIKKLSVDSNMVTDEHENIDVYDKQNKIAVECGDVYAKKLLDLFNNRYADLKNVNDFRILTYWGFPNLSKCYKYSKEMDFI